MLFWFIVHSMYIDMCPVKTVLLELMEDLIQLTIRYMPYL